MCPDFGNTTVLSVALGESSVLSSEIQAVFISFSTDICCSDWQRLRACGYHPRVCDSGCPLAPVWQTKYKGDRKEKVLLRGGPCNWKGRKQGGKGMHSDVIKPRFCLCLVKFPEQGAALG